MTYQESIKWIDGRVLELSSLVDITSTDKGMQRINEEYNALLRSRAAIEKQIQMAPVRIIINDDKLWKKVEYRCEVCMEPIFIVEDIAHPVCGWQRYTHGDRSPFCPDCGQALKWEESRE